MNKIIWWGKASKQLKKIHPQHQDVVYSSVLALENGLEGKDVKALQNHQYDYRLRVGQYRVLFNFDQDSNTIDVREVKKRDENTY